MKLSKKITSIALASALILGIAGCSSETPQSTSATTTTNEKQVLDEIDWGKLSADEVDSANEVGTGSLYESGKTAGTVKGLCYYDFAMTQPELAEIFAERFGGTIETEVCSSSEFSDKLSVMVAGGTSPDIVRYDWQAIPHGVSKNMYMPLDEWLDIDSPLWATVKDTINAFEYNGKHYYFPSNVKSHFALNYNKTVLEAAGIEDPMKLYEAGDWTLDTFADILAQWAAQGEEYVPLTGGSWSAMMFVHTTGTSIIDIADGTIVNNLKDQNVQRTMEWIEGLRKQGYIGDGYVDPGEAFLDGTLLFLAMDPQWTYSSAQESLTKKNIDNDMAVLPFPRDPKADKYYTSVDTFGFLVPAGASNVQGAIGWILSGRLYETDEDILAETKAEMLSTDPVYYAKCAECKYSFTENGTNDLTSCPECGTPRKEKFKVTYTEEQWDVLQDMINPEKMSFVFDFATGFSDDMSALLIGNENSVLDGPMYNDASYTQLRDTNYNAIESYLEPYREKMQNP